MADERFRSILYGFLGISAAALIVNLLMTYGIAGSHYKATTAGYMLSFAFVGSNFLVIRNFTALSSAEFNKRFFISLGIRFILVLVVFVFVLKAIKIHQIYFTVSFIISYIFHSVIEIISINKLLETDN